MDSGDERPLGELIELESDECFRLVATLEVGRIAVAGSGLAPLVVPVNYVLDGDTIVFRTDEGSKLLALLENPASFQVDFLDSFHRTGWSVLIQGAVEEVDGDQLTHLALHPWAPGRKVHWLKLVPFVVTGRRLDLPLYVVDPRGYV
jgi:nitroimidazol reductase NimA-like FMN-containing flavoprotein (pyridoxamine 5'-phosphate oxidase superfamily)